MVTEENREFELFAVPLAFLYYSTAEMLMEEPGPDRIGWRRRCCTADRRCGGHRLGRGGLWRYRCPWLARGGEHRLRRIILDTHGRDIHQEQRRRVVLLHPIDAPPRRAGEKQPRLSSRNANIAQTAFLFHLRRLIERATVGKQAVLHTSNEYHWKFEPLRGVQGHQHHRPAVVRQAILVRNQGSMLQKLLETRPRHMTVEL